MGVAEYAQVKQGGEGHSRRGRAAFSFPHHHLFLQLFFFDKTNIFGLCGSEGGQNKGDAGGNKEGDSRNSFSTAARVRH
jgi:hypothetical protein